MQQTLHQTLHLWESARESRDMRTILTSWYQQVLQCLEQRRQRRWLLRLDDRMLKDIGITRADAVNEASKPCWRK